MSQVSLSTEGLLDPAKLRAWTLAQQKKIHAGTARAMVATGRVMAADAQASATRAFGGKRRAAGSIRSKLFDRKPNELPALKIGSKIPWLGLHERGGVQTGNMLIPFGDGRPRRFGSLIKALMDSGNAYFRTVGAHAILFAENIPDNASILRQFKSRARNLGIVETRGKTGKTIKRGTDIPVAILVKRVVIKKKLGLEKTVMAHLPRLARAIETEIGRG